MKTNYVGYLDLGASTKEEAIKKQGIQIFLTKKPSLFKRLMWLYFFGVYWINEIDKQ